MEKNNEAGNNNRRNIPPKKDGVNQYSINERIRAREVRLVGENVEQGVYSTHEALRIAEEQGLDLVEISPNAVPPVCRIIDYQKLNRQRLLSRRYVSDLRPTTTIITSSSNMQKDSSKKGQK